MNMDKIAKARIEELEAQNLDLEIKLDLVTADREERDAYIRTLEQQIIEMRTVRYTDVAATG